MACRVYVARHLARESASIRFPFFVKRMPRSSSHRTLILCLGVSLATASMFSTEGVEIAENQDAQLYVLLRNGEVIRGSVQRDADHLIIKRNGSVELRIPQKQISFIGADLTSVYEHRANQIIEFHADEHLELASWCLQNRLIGPATRHILRRDHSTRPSPALVVEGTIGAVLGYETETSREGGFRCRC